MLSSGDLIFLVTTGKARLCHVVTISLLALKEWQPSLLYDAPSDAHPRKQRGQYRHVLMSLLENTSSCSTSAISKVLRLVEHFVGAWMEMILLKRAWNVKQDLECQTRYHKTDLFLIIH